QEIRHYSDGVNILRNATFDSFFNKRRQYFKKAIVRKIIPAFFLYQLANRAKLFSHFRHSTASINYQHCFFQNHHPRFILATASVRLGGNLCFGIIRSPPELRIAAASETLRIPSNFLTTCEGFGTVTFASKALSYNSSGILNISENLFSPPSASFLFSEEMFLTESSASPFSLNTSSIPFLMSSAEVSL